MKSDDSGHCFRNKAKLKLKLFFGLQIMHPSDLKTMLYLICHTKSRENCKNHCVIYEKG